MALETIDEELLKCLENAVKRCEKVNEFIDLIDSCAFIGDNGNNTSTNIFFSHKHQIRIKNITTLFYPSPKNLKKKLK